MNVSTLAAIFFGASAFCLTTAELAEKKLKELRPQKQITVNQRPVSIEAAYKKDSVVVVEKFKDYEDVNFSDSLLSLYIKFTHGQVTHNYKIKPITDSIYSSGYPVYTDEKKFIKVDIHNSNKSVRINDSLKIKIPQVEIKPKS